MCYEAAIASARGDEATLAKSLIISLQDVAANWYSKLPPCYIYSWQQLKDKILLNFQGFQTELDTKEFFFVRSKGERFITRILSKVPLAQSPNTKGVRRASHSSSHKSFEGRAIA
jgi:hypothetical protein